MTDTGTVCGHPGDTPGLCHGCRLSAAADLQAIRTHHRDLADHLAPAGGAAGVRTVPASRPPLAVDPLSLAARGGVGGVLGSWCQLLLEEDRITRLPGHRLSAAAHVDACCRALAGQLGWLCDQPYADELAAELAQLRADIDAVLGLAERLWRPLPGRWRCPTDGCGGTLLQHADEWLVRCPACRRTWDGEGPITRLGVLLGCELTVTVEQAATLIGVHRTTVYRWIADGALPQEVRAGRVVVDRRDLAVLAARCGGA